MTIRINRMVRAGALLTLWLLYASLPLLASVGQADPFACCRVGGKHGCSMRMHRRSGGLTVGAFVKLCPVASARSHAPLQAATSAVPPRIVRDLVQARSLPSTKIKVVRSARSIRSPRAPPQRG